MQSREIVRRAIEFDIPPRLPFFLGGSWSDKLSRVIQDFPNDVCDCWEMDRQEAGWFFDNPVQDDWGCMWRRPLSTVCPAQPGGRSTSGARSAG